MLLFFGIIAIIIVCILSFLIVRVWVNPNVDDPTQTTSIQQGLGSIGPQPGTNTNPNSGLNPGSAGNHSGGTPYKPSPPGGNSEG